MSDLDSLIDDLLASEKSAQGNHDTSFGPSDGDDGDTDHTDGDDDIEVSAPPPGVDVAALRKSNSTKAFQAPRVGARENYEPVNDVPTARSGGSARSASVEEDDYDDDNDDVLGLLHFDDEAPPTAATRTVAPQPRASTQSSLGRRGSIVGSTVSLEAGEDAEGEFDEQFEGGGYNPLASFGGGSAEPTTTRARAVHLGSLDLYEKDERRETRKGNATSFPWERREVTAKRSTGTSNTTVVLSGVPPQPTEESVYVAGTGVSSPFRHRSPLSATSASLSERLSPDHELPANARPDTSFAAAPSAASSAVAESKGVRCTGVACEYRETLERERASWSVERECMNVERQAWETERQRLQVEQETAVAQARRQEQAQQQQQQMQGETLHVLADDVQRNAAQLGAMRERLESVQEGTLREREAMLERRERLLEEEQARVEQRARMVEDEMRAGREQRAQAEGEMRGVRERGERMLFEAQAMMARVEADRRTFDETMRVERSAQAGIVVREREQMERERERLQKEREEWTRLRAKREAEAAMGEARGESQREEERVLGNKRREVMELLVELDSQREELRLEKETLKSEQEEFVRHCGDLAARAEQIETAHAEAMSFRDVGEQALREAEAMMADVVDGQRVVERLRAELRGREAEAARERIELAQRRKELVEAEVAVKRGRQSRQRRSELETDTEDDDNEDSDGGELVLRRGGTAVWGSHRRALMQLQEEVQQDASELRNQALYIESLAN